METANLPSVVSLGLKSPASLVPTTYTVDVGQSIFSKQPLKDSEDQLSGHSVKLEDTDFDYDIEYSTEHVPLGEILERLQAEDRAETADKSNLIRLHAATNDSSAATISATLNFASLDLSQHSNLQHHLSEINDVLFSINKPADSSLSLASSVPEVNSIFSTSPSPASSEQELQSPRSVGPGLLNLLAQSPPLDTKVSLSPQECNLCQKMFGNASALAKHRLTHSDERKYLCTVCHKAFKRQDHLNGHLLTHRNKKPFECTTEGCNKSYCDARSLRRHRENHHSGKEEKCQLVSPASSIASSDLDEKSLGSESCDGSPGIKGTKLVFTGLNSLDKDKITKITTDTAQFQLLEQLIRESKECETGGGNGGVGGGVGGGGGATVTIKTSHSHPLTLQHSSISPVTKPEPEPTPNMVECSICARKFKNIPALNGHMRLHGGYYRKDSEKHKQAESQRSAGSGYPEASVSTHRVSSNVISLIEEKIIQKRKLSPTASVSARPSLSLSSLTSLSSLPSRSTLVTTSCSTSSSSVSEPAPKRLALDNNLNISSLDNLVFPQLPQPDTDSLLANLQSKQQAGGELSPLLPDAPLPDQRLQPPPHLHHNKLLKINRTNFQPSLGSEHQAVLPALRSRPEEFRQLGPSHQYETQMWSPHIDHHFSQTQFETYLKLASSSAVKDSANNLENALSILLQCNGSIIKATQRLLGFIKVEENSSSPLPKYWTAEEVDMFYEALCKHKKDFAKISGDLPNKTSQDCVEFYYLWKNICREESQSFKSIINDSSEEISSAVLAI